MILIVCSSQRSTWDRTYLTGPRQGRIPTLVESDLSQPFDGCCRLRSSLVVQGKIKMTLNDTLLNANMSARMSVTCHLDRQKTMGVRVSLAVAEKVDEHG